MCCRWNITKLDERGFTVVEMLIILALLAIAVIGYTTMLNTVRLTTVRSKRLSTANEIAFAKLQEYENRLYDNIPATSTIPMVNTAGNSCTNGSSGCVDKCDASTITSNQMTAPVESFDKSATIFNDTSTQSDKLGNDRSMNVYVASRSTNLKFICLVLTYDDGNTLRNVIYSDYIQKGGVGR